MRIAERMTKIDALVDGANNQCVGAGRHQTIMDIRIKRDRQRRH